MSLIINPQYAKFVQFAESQADAIHSKTIARVDGNGVPGGVDLACRNIKASDSDKVGSWWRNQSDKDANDVVRNLFRQSIIDMFGGEALIPPKVKTAMRLKDYNCGKPLTARRIMAVKTEVDKLLQQHADFNAGIKKALLSSNTDKFEALPQDFRDAMTGHMERFRNLFGEKVVPRNWDMSKIMSPNYITQELTTLCNTASAQGRDVTANEVIGLYATRAFERLVSEVFGAKLMPQIKELAPQTQYSEQAIGSLFLLRNPAIRTELNACANPNDVEALFARHVEDLQTFVNLAAGSDNASHAAETKAHEKLAAAFGLDVTLVSSCVPTSNLRSEASELHARILRGEEPGSTVPGYSFETDYDRLVDNFVQKRVEVYNSIDSLDLPDSVKGRWKAMYIAYDKVPDISPAQLFEVISKIDIAKFKTAISGVPANEAAQGLNDVIESINDEICKETGNPGFFEKGFDDLFPILGMLIIAAEGKDPELAQAIQTFRETAIGDLITYCEDNKHSDAVMLLQVVEMVGGTNKQLPVTNKMKFQNVLEIKVDAELDANQIANAKLRKTVKDAVVARGLEFLESAKTLKDLSVFLSQDLKAIVGENLRPTLEKRAEIIGKYSAQLAPETRHILNNLVNALNWNDASAEESEQIVKNFVEDMKTWRNVVPGSQDAKGLESVFERRMDTYLKFVLEEHNVKYFNTANHPGFFQTFLDDLDRTSRYTINGKPVTGKTLDERLAPFGNAIKDPKKLKAVSVMINQQVFGEFTASVANRLPLVGWTSDMKDESTYNIPGIEKFASRDIAMTGMQLFDTGVMEFELTVSPDENTVKVRAKTGYPIHSHISMPHTFVGTCSVVQEFTIDLSGEKPAIKNFTIGQTFS